MQVKQPKTFVDNSHSLRAINITVRWQSPVEKNFLKPVVSIKAQLKFTQRFLHAYMYDAVWSLRRPLSTGTVTNLTLEMRNTSFER